MSELSREVKSFCTFALAIAPSVSVRGETYEDGVKTCVGVDFQLNDSKKISDRDFSTIEELAAKFERVKKFLPSESTLKDLKTFSERPTVSFEPDTKYELVTLYKEQLELAADISERVSKTLDFHKAGDIKSAKTEFDGLQKTLAEKRETFLGDFARIPEIDDAVGMHGVGTNGNPQIAAGGGAIIFVIVEIYIS